MVSSSESDLSQLEISVLRRAVDLYLRCAYPASPPPPVVLARATWPDGQDMSSLLSRTPFERANRAAVGVAPIYALRLGNASYPHMKMQVQAWPTPWGFLLSVNTHDQVHAIEPGSSEAIAFLALQAENQRFKETIEQAWDEAGLPTFLRYLREYILSQATTASVRDAGELASGEELAAPERPVNDDGPVPES
jgi:hypothetical protein